MNAWNDATGIPYWRAFAAFPSQHWLNLLPAEIDLTDYDKAAAAQNESLAKVGEEFINKVARSQHDFVVDNCGQIIDHYYEANLLSRNRSRTDALDQFALDDSAAVRGRLTAAAEHASLRTN